VRSRILSIKPVIAVIAAVVLIGPATPATAAGVANRPSQRFTIASVSNPHPEFISGGDVLLRVTNAGATPRFEIDGRHVAATVEPNNGGYLALIDGISAGRHEITAIAGHDRAHLRVRDFGIDGPVFSGPRQEPYICETTAYGLPAASPPACAVPTQVSYLYKTTAGAFQPLADSATRPADLATAAVGGHSVPYIIRLEQGTIDRAVYQIAALYDGTSPVPFTPDASWNRRLVYTFGGGCDAGYHQGSATGGVINDLFLAQGYAVASSSLNVLDTNCSTIISAEAAMMVKEHFIEEYGPVAHTIGWGGSGGAIQQYDIADQYPGILDGIVPGVSFPDPFTTLGPVTDCRLLDNYFGAGGNGFTAAQQVAIAGFNVYDTCRSWDATFANRITATGSCNPVIPVALRWDPVTNPDGVKCAANEQYINQLGVDHRTGFAPSPLDNVGVQYGLAALQKGQITPAQFAALNAGIGGFDYTGTPQAGRSVADPRALSVSYRDDLVNSGGQGLAQTAVIDQRIDLDFAGPGNDIHTAEWSYVMRARMTAAGTVGNQVIIENNPATVVAASVYELAAMDQWLTAIDADTSDRPLSVKVSADRPAAIGDGCFLNNGSFVHEQLSYDGTGQCASTIPVAANTRLVAGEPLSMTVLKCHLKPLDFSAYPVTFTDAEKAQLRAAFPTGVCDYQRPGVGQQRPTGTWLDYGSR